MNSPDNMIVDEVAAVQKVQTRKNNMTLLACMYMAGLVQPKLIPSIPEKIKLVPTPLPMKKESLEAQAAKIRKAEDKRHARQVRNIQLKQEN